MRKILCILTIGFLSACSSISQESSKQPVEAPRPSVVDPSDAVLKQSIRAFLEKTEAPKASRYKFVRHDLNRDGRRDALVLFETPYGYWCGKHGCTLMIMKASNTSFSIVNSIQPLREPLYISGVRTNGWHNIIARISGRSAPAKDVEMVFNGRAYPTNPDALPPNERLALSQYIKVFE